MPVFDHFGILAPFYERFIRMREPERLTALLDMPVGGALLDAGGGTGRIAHYFREVASPLVIADESAAMLTQARQKNGIETVCGYTEQMSFPDATFDRVIMVDVFHHVNNQSATVRELWRVLKPNGRLVIEEPDIRKFSVKMIAVFEKLALMRSHFVPPEKIAAMFCEFSSDVFIDREGFNAWVVVDKPAVG